MLSGASAVISRVAKTDHGTSEFECTFLNIST